MVIYNTASLFNAREKLHNIALTDSLTQLGHDIILPQRDGFEFSKLHQYLNAVLPPSEVTDALQMIIFLLDMGYFIPQSNAVVACVDEPVDEALVLEITAGIVLGKQVVCWRSDVRSPFGKINDPFGGLHFFIPMFCDGLVLDFPLSTSLHQAEEEVKTLALSVDSALKKMAVPKSQKIEKGFFIELINSAQLLFDGIDIHNLHNEANTLLIVERYLQHKTQIEKLRPKLF